MKKANLNDENFLIENEKQIREEFAKLCCKPIPEILQRKIVYEYWVSLPKSKKDIKLMATNEKEAIKECEKRFGKFSCELLYSIYRKFLKYDDFNCLKRINPFVNVVINL